MSPPNAGYAPAPLPARTDSAPTPGGEAQQFAIGRDIQFDWWTLFKSPALDALVQQAFKANPTIDSAVAAIERRNTVTLSITERLLYLDLNGMSFSTAVEEHRPG